MGIVNQKLPFFLSLNNGLLQVVGGIYNNNRFQLESYGAAKIPIGTSVQGEIKQKEIAAKLINNLINQSRPEKIKANSCYVVLPDQYVFSKLLTIPKVKDDELESAINFKIKDFLPYQPEETYLDYQKITEKNGSVEVSVAAVKKNIIDSYLQTLGMINIFPLGFEPESFSLSRLASLTSQDPSLVIFNNGQKSIFCFSQHGGTLLETIIHFLPQQRNEQEILQELGKSIKFWLTTLGRVKKIKNVFMAGTGEDEFVYSQIIKANLGLQISKLPLPINLPQGFPPNNFSQLIPLFGLALREIKSFSETKQILLIPKEVQKSRSSFQFKNNLNLLFQITSIFLCFLISVFFFVFLSLFFQLEQTKASLSGWEKIVFTKRQTDLEKQAVNINQKIISLDKALSRRQAVSTFLTDFSRQFQAGITITEFNYDATKNSLQLKGNASSREDITSLEKSLAKLGEVSIPLSSFEQSQSPKFTAVIKLKP